MIVSRHAWWRRAPLPIALALVACGGGGGSSNVGVVAAGPSTPSPAPTPTPSPTVTTSGKGPSVPADTLTGLAKIASGVDVSRYLVPSWGTGAVAGQDGDDMGAFRFLCAPSHNAWDDPIVYPGQPGRSHLHTFFGNTKTDANSTFASLRTTGESTCNNLLARSAYWIPAMMNGRGKVVMPDYLVVYYKRLPASDPRCTMMAKACLPLPRGLRYVFGYNMSEPTNSAPTSKYWWNCDGAGAVTGWFRNIAQAAKGCPIGARLGAILEAPKCWNGTELDSPDHRSHMSYSIYDANGVEKCPATHPYLVPAFSLGAWYTTDATLDRSGDESVGASTWYLASDRMAGMADAVPGTTLHSDWFGAWEDSILELWTANCIDRKLSCSGGDLGNGQQMTMTAGYDYGSKTVLVDPPAMP